MNRSAVLFMLVISLAGVAMVASYRVGRESGLSERRRAVTFTLPEIREIQGADTALTDVTRSIVDAYPVPDRDLIKSIQFTDGPLRYEGSCGEAEGVVGTDDGGDIRILRDSWCVAYLGYTVTHEWCHLRQYASSRILELQRSDPTGGLAEADADACAASFGWPRPVSRRPP